VIDRTDLRTVAGRVFQGLAHLARVRATLPQLHASASSRVLTDTDDGVLAAVRRHASGPLVALYNVTADPRPFPIGRLHDLGLATPYDALGGHEVTAGADGLVLLPAYAAWWVVDADA
jgi:amylosucrase